MEAVDVNQVIFEEVKMILTRYFAVHLIGGAQIVQYNIYWESEPTTKCRLKAAQSTTNVRANMINIHCQ